MFRDWTFTFANPFLLKITTVTVRLDLRQGLLEVMFLPDFAYIFLTCSGGCVDHIITFTREGYQDFGCDTFV